MSGNDKPTLFRPIVGARGMTALHYSAYTGDLSGLDEQLRAGADPNLKDQYRGYAALHWLMDMAATGGGPRLEMLRRLVAHGARVDASADNGATPLSLAREAGNSTGGLLAAELTRLGAKA